MFTTCTIGHLCSAFGMAQLFQKNVQPFIYGLLPVIYLVAILPETSNDVFRLGETVGNIAMYLYGLMPLVLLVISIWRGKKREATP
ncbi:hypothetical protein BP422_09660 [Brevibacillus formosus]|uniref:Spore germination protein n=2 Tax=Brevibacillus formosus TaxID=54913 RepID=A0A220MFT1_9BACL|nr:hypothetical protein BP422_09660 [Brevibacillus formosus]